MNVEFGNHAMSSFEFESGAVLEDVNVEYSTMGIPKYDEDGNMNEVTDENEWEMCQEVLGAFSNEDEEDEA